MSCCKRQKRLFEILFEQPDGSDIKESGIAFETTFSLSTYDVFMLTEFGVSSVNHPKASSYPINAFLLLLTTCQCAQFLSSPPRQSLTLFTHLTPHVNLIR